jgi:putative transposase
VQTGHDNLSGDRLQRRDKKSPARYQKKQKQQRRLQQPEAARTRYAGYRFPAEIIGHAVWLYFRFPLGLRVVEELLAARDIIVSHETVRQWARKFGQQFANQIRRRLPQVGERAAPARIPRDQSQRARAASFSDVCLRVCARARD